MSAEKPPAYFTYEQQEAQQSGGFNQGPPPPGGWNQGPPPMTQQPQSQQQAPTTIYVSNRAFGKFPVQVTCPNCKASIETRVDSHTGIIQWLTAGGICLIGCWLGCCLIPLCVDDWRDVDHFCPNCNALVGRYKFGL